MTASRPRALVRLTAAGIAAALLPLLPGAATGAAAATRPAPTKARLVKVVKTVAFPHAAKPGAVETDPISGSDALFCGYRMPATLSVTRATEDLQLSVGYLPTRSAASAKSFVGKVRAKRSCEGGALRRTTLADAPKGTAALVLAMPVDDTHTIKLYLAMVPTGRSIAVATAGTKRDTAVLLSRAVRSYRKAGLA
jgi:hypothetical protein